MSWTLVFLPEATEEAAEATAYYEEQVAGLGVRFRAEVETVCAAIVRQPLLWRERSGGNRRASLPGFPHYIAYFLRGERIIVAAVGHGARHPNYWRARVG
jgi:plasmid stabilization system protein ParE